jgi:2-dehydro-3-deoxygalactonokinase
MNEFFINCDWGTTHFRLRAICRRGTQIIADFRSDEGVARLAASKGSHVRADLFQAVLSAGLEQLRAAVGQGLAAAPVLISGMASSSIGWLELPYAQVPLSLDGADLIWKELQPAAGMNAQRVVLVSGARTESDVMRGEETQALGVFQLLAAKSLADRSILVLPGTHSKHLQATAGRIESFRTFMTGELFDVLSKHSILRYSIDSNEPVPDALEGKSLEAFQSGVNQARDLPLPAALFRVRTRKVLRGLPAETNRAFLSGVLIGSELAYLLQSEWSNWPVLLAAAAPLQRPYRLAFEALGLSDRLTSISPHDVERLSALGQQTLLAHLGFSGSPDVCG